MTRQADARGTSLSKDLADVLRAAIRYHQMWLSAFSATAARSPSSRSFDSLVREFERLSIQCSKVHWLHDLNNAETVVMFDWTASDFHLAKVACDSYLEHVELLSSLSTIAPEGIGETDAVIVELDSIKGALNALQMRLEQTRDHVSQAGA